MNRTAKIILQTVGVAVMAGLLIAAVVSGYKARPAEKECRSLRYIIEDREERAYLTEVELTQLLRANDLYPVNRVIAPTTLYRIEKTIARHPMVRTAQCYITPRGEMRIRITQRVPILRVQTPIEVYFIDSDRRVMEARESVKDRVPVVTGNVGITMASHALADFALWLQGNEYWRARVHHMHVHNPQMVYIYLYQSNDTKAITFHRVVLGPMRGYEQKLQKLRVFLENGAVATKDKQYNEIDLRFKGQVVGRN